MTTWDDEIDITEEQWRNLLSDEEIVRKDDFELLKQIYYTKDFMATASQLANRMNISHYQQLTAQVVNMSKRIIKKLGIQAPKREDGSIRWWLVPFKGMQNHEGCFWILRPELKSAMSNMLEANENYRSPDELDPNDSVLFEGAKKQIYVNAYERNPVARNKCINIYGFKCIVCGFDFADVYGNIGENTIHVHHKKPLSEINEQYIVDPVNDLAPVCPNCHLIIHKKSPPYSIEEVKEMIRRNCSKSG